MTMRDFLSSSLSAEAMGSIFSFLLPSPPKDFFNSLSHERRFWNGFAKTGRLTLKSWTNHPQVQGVDHSIQEKYCANHAPRDRG
jgi:hypothetical protein